ncbi:hypothetical protein NH514_12310 [Pseudoalteromonas sp. ACER1]|uniref:hypothetical protein n=1 Tax=unclassified Pseudoalteromonas TaxID=194690 RepID=UPI001F2D60B8|nr:MULTISPECIES: hypothetical protein [unclassified Pseudoalteromonas]MCF2847888.1 hypothetical protein [Pseudoalteromonas sp. PAST1]MCO7211518.1 hypothetical protein [Pseudoalteromonas sp. ACER1]
MNSEDFSYNYLIKKLKLPTNHIEKFDGQVQKGHTSSFNCMERLKSMSRDYWTPDFIVSSNPEEDSLKEICFVDVNGPKGGLLTRVDIAISEEIERSKADAFANKSIGKVVSIELSKQLTPLIEGVTNKLNEINRKYANNRDKKGLKSFNTGLIYCLESEDKVKHANCLDSHQLSITVLELCHLLSDGYCQYHDIEHKGLNRVTRFNFHKDYRNIGFVIFIGRGFLANQSYIFANNRFLNNSNNVFAQQLKMLPSIDGNSFRAKPTSKSRLVLDCMLEEINEENPHVFPYGNINYKGDKMPGVEGVELKEVDVSKIKDRFEQGLNES